MTGIAHDRTAAERLAADVAAAEAARHALAASGEPGHEALLNVALVVTWAIAASVLANAGLPWPSYALIVLAACAMPLPPWLRARRLRRQLDAALLLLARYEHPVTADETADAPSVLRQTPSAACRAASPNRTVLS